MAQSKPSAMDPHAIPLLSESNDDEEQQRYVSNQSLYPPHPPPRRPLLNRYSWIVALVLLVLFIGLLAVPKPSQKEPSDVDDDYDEDAPTPDSKGICRQMNMKELPDDNIQAALAEALRSEEYLRGSIERLSGAVQIPTETFDDMGPVGEDPRWDLFQRFHDYLEQTYPSVYELPSLQRLMEDIRNCGLKRSIRGDLYILGMGRIRI